jgi:hypothetical protein
VALGSNGARSFLLAGRTLHEVTAAGGPVLRQLAAVATDVYVDELQVDANGRVLMLRDGRVMRWRSGATWEPLL